MKFKDDDLVVVYLRKERFPASTYKTQRKFGPCRVLKKLGHNAYHIVLPVGLFISPTFNTSDLYPYYGDEDKITLKPRDIQFSPSNPPRELIDVLDVRLITTQRGTYTQYLVHWQGKPESEDAWISSEELKMLDHMLWEDLTSYSKVSSFQEGENDARAKNPS
jgi:hypothetical protein